MPTARRPRIGILSDRRRASFGAWSDVDLSFVWTHYVEALDHAGGLPVVFPTTAFLAERPGEALDAVDALLLPGGRDLAAESYGAEPHPANEPGDPERDRAELALCREALDRGLPILGVCRGMQLLNLVLGGGIEQHLEDADGVHRAQPGSFTSHDVEIVPGSRLAEIAGGDRARVRSHHHQGIAPLADDLSAVAHAPDGVIEAAELDGDGFCLAVLWHPEEDLEGGGSDLYRALVAAAEGG